MRNLDSQLCLCVAKFLDGCNWEGTLQISRNWQQSPTSWQQLSVATFLISGSWEERVILPHSPRLEHWLCSSVEQFFNRSWEGQPIISHESQGSCFTRKVQDFMQFLPWDGKTKIGVLPKAWSAPKTISAFDVPPTLTTLSELF